MDSDGTFCITKSNRTFQPVVAVLQTKPQIPNWLLGLGGEVIDVSKEGERKKGKNSRDAFLWRARTREFIRHFCALLRPYLLLKIEQCELMIEAVSRPDGRGRGAEWWVEEYETRKSIWLKMKELNKTGYK